jgi:hypothetical protein
MSAMRPRKLRAGEICVICCGVWTESTATSEEPSSIYLDSQTLYSSVVAVDEVVE